jgi:HEAT repeat protein
VRSFPPPSVHGPLLRACVELGEAITPYILELLDHQRPQIRFYAAFLFQELRDPRALRPLAARAFDPDPDVRQIATRVLESFNRTDGFVEATELVRAALIGRDRDRALLATEAAGTLRDTRAVPILIDMLSVRDKQIRETALEALCSITAKHHGYRPAKWKSWYEDHGEQPRVMWVMDALKHRDPAVRRWAADELTRVTGHRIPPPPEGEKITPRYVLHAWDAWWTHHGAAFR